MHVSGISRVLRLLIRHPHLCEHVSLSRGAVSLGRRFSAPPSGWRATCVVVRRGAVGRLSSEGGRPRDTFAELIALAHNQTDSASFTGIMTLKSPEDRSHASRVSNRP
jgi:hypothetical protein